LDCLTSATVGLIESQEDTIAPVGQAGQLESLIPGVPLSILQGAGFVSQIEEPGAFHKALILLLQSIVIQQQEISADEEV